MKQQIAGDFKNEVAEIEDSKQQSELLACNGQFFVHGKRGKADVVPIDEGNHEEQQDKGKNAKAKFLDRLRSDRGQCYCRATIHQFCMQS